MATLPGITVTAPRRSDAPLDLATISGGYTSSDLLKRVRSDGPTSLSPNSPYLSPAPIAAPPIAAPPIAAPINTVLPELTVSASKFQGPMPSPGGGGAPTLPRPSTTSIPPAPKRYDVPEASTLRKLRFILEELAKKGLKLAKNIIPKMPTPMTFLVDGLLIGSDVADATLFKPGEADQDLPTVLPEVTIWAQRLRSPKQSLSPSPLEMPIPQPMRIPSPERRVLPRPLFDPDLLPLPEMPPLPLSVPELPTMDPEATPVELPTPTQIPGFSPAPLITPQPLRRPAPFPVRPTVISRPGPAPKFDTPPFLGPTGSPAPAPAPQKDAPIPRQGGCGEVEPEKKKKKRKDRTECYSGTFTETSKSTRKQRKRKIPCQ